MARMADHLSVSEWERCFADCAAPVGARHVQVIGLLARDGTVGATSKVTTFGAHWVEPLL